MGMDWGQLLGTLGGAWLGSQNGAKQAGTKNPWGPMQPFLVGGQGNIPGLADQAANIYMSRRGGMPDYLRGAYRNMFDISNNASHSPIAQALQGNIFNLLSGQRANLGFGQPPANVGPQTSPREQQMYSMYRGPNADGSTTFSRLRASAPAYTRDMPQQLQGYQYDANNGMQ